MRKLLLLAVAGLIAAPARASIDWSAPAPSEVLAQAKNKAKGMPDVPAKREQAPAKAKKAQAAQPTRLAGGPGACYANYGCDGPLIGYFSSSSSCDNSGGYSWFGNDMLCHDL